MSDEQIEHLRDRLHVMEQERDAARTERDKLRAVLESLKALLKSEQVRFPIDGTGKAVAAEVLFIRDRLACLDADPPECVRIRATGDIDPHERAGYDGVTFTDAGARMGGEIVGWGLKKGDDCLIIRLKETP